MSLRRAAPRRCGSRSACVLSAAGIEPVTLGSGQVCEDLGEVATGANASADETASNGGVDGTSG